MAASINTTSNASSMPQALLDPVDFEPMEDAVSLIGCNHTVRQKTADLWRKNSKEWRCPLCQSPIEKYVPNFTVRSAVLEIINTGSNKSVKEPEQEVPLDSVTINALNTQTNDVSVVPDNANNSPAEFLTPSAPPLTFEEKIDLLDENHASKSGLEASNTTPTFKFAAPSAPPLSSTEKVDILGRALVPPSYEKPLAAIRTSYQSVNSRTYPSDDFYKGSVRPMITIHSKDFKKSSLEKRQQLKKKLGLSIGGFGFSIKNKDEAIDKFKEFFLDVRDLILNIQDAKLEEIDDFNINFDLAVATYTCPETNDKVAVDLLNLTNDENQQFINAYLDAATELLHLSTNKERFKISKHGKGNIKGKKPLLRDESHALKKLPFTFAECAVHYIPKSIASFASSQRTIIIERLLFAEVLQNKLSEGLDILIKNKQGELDKIIENQSAPQIRKRVNELRQELTLLKALMRHFKELDAYALTMVLINYPTTRPFAEDIDKCVKKTEEELLKVLNYNPNYKLEAHMQAIAAYACDVGGMFHVSRWDYYSYFHKKNMAMKQSRIEDFILLEAISYADGRRQQGRFVIEAIYEEVNDEIRSDIQNIINGIDFPNILPKIIEGENQDFQTLRKSISGLEVYSSKANSESCDVM